MMSEPDQDGNTHRIVQRDYYRPKPVTKTLKHLRRVAKSAEHTLGRKMSTLEGGQYVLLVKALRQNRSGQVHEVVEIVGSPGLKESFEAHLSDVLNDFPADKDATDGNGTTVEEHVADDAAELDVPPLSTLASSGVALVREDSQDSILDIEGCSDDEVSLIEWGSQENNAQPLKESSTLCEAVETTAAEEVPGCPFRWRSMVHEDDPFLSLISCEIPRVVACLEKTSFDHLQAYQQLGFHITGSWHHWYTEGAGHRVWESVRAGFPEVFCPPLVCRALSRTPESTNHASSTRATKQTKGIIKPSRARQQAAAQAKFLRLSIDHHLL